MTKELLELFKNLTKEETEEILKRLKERYKREA